MCPADAVTAYLKADALFDLSDQVASAIPLELTTPSASTRSQTLLTLAEKAKSSELVSSPVSQSRNFSKAVSFGENFWLADGASFSSSRSSSNLSCPAGARGLSLTSWRKNRAELHS